MKILKYVLLFIVVPAITVLFMRSYVIEYATNSFQFGCETAALRVYKFYSAPLGLDLKRFCGVYTNNIKKEFNGEFDK